MALITNLNFISYFTFMEKMKTDTGFIFYVIWLCLIAFLIGLEIIYKYFKARRAQLLQKVIMQLSLIQFFKRTVPGHIFRGKQRLVKRVSQRAMDTLVRDYELQENNMLLLRHPYLTFKESSGHAKDLNKKDEFIKKWREIRAENKMRPHVLLEDRLNHLKVNESWD